MSTINTINNDDSRQRLKLGIRLWFIHKKGVWLLSKRLRDLWWTHRLLKEEVSDGSQLWSGVSNSQVRVF